MKPRVVAIQGEAGSFSETAACRLVASPRLAFYDSFKEAAQAVSSGAARYGVLPVANSLAGEVIDLPSFLQAHGLTAVKEIPIAIRQCLVAACPAALEEILEVRSHPVALRQCGRFFTDHPWMSPVSVTDTAGAVREICAARTPGVAAIAGMDAAERYGGCVLVEDIADSADNVTTFVLVERGRAS